MSNPVRIALAGKKFSGKSTLEKALRHRLELDYSVSTISVAQPLKEGLHRMGVRTDGPYKDAQAMQDIGDYFRRRNPDWWINLLLEDIDTLIEYYPAQAVIVSDVRYPNEAVRLQERGFRLVRLHVIRKQQDQRAHERGEVFTDAIASHPSETALDGYGDYDLILGHDRTPEQQLASVMRLINSEGR